jgi:hypothetical protein
VIPLVHIFIDHSNIWGGARLASRIEAPGIDDSRARISVRNLDRILSKKRRGVTTKIVSGGIPPGMETVWSEYQKAGPNANQPPHAPIIRLPARIVDKRPTRSAAPVITATADLACVLPAEDSRPCAKSLFSVSLNGCSIVHGLSQ